MSEERRYLLDFALRRGTIAARQHALMSRMSDEEYALANQLIGLVHEGARQTVETVDLANDIDVSDEDRAVLLRGMMAGDTDTPECRAILARAKFKPGKLARWKRYVDGDK